MHTILLVDDMRSFLDLEATFLSRAECRILTASTGLEAIRVIRGLNSPNIGMVYVACHTFHMGHSMREIMREAGDLLRLVHVADTMDHHRSHGLRYITNPPGNSVRVHQHLKIGDGDVDWADFFEGLSELGFLDRDDTVMASSVFAEDENALEVSRYQLRTMTEWIDRVRAGTPTVGGD